MTFFFDVLPAAATAAEAAAAGTAAAATAAEAGAAVATGAAAAGAAGTAAATATTAAAATGAAAAGGSFLSTVGSAISAASPYLAGASALVSAGGSIMSGQQQAAAGRYNARVSEANALAAQQAGAGQSNLLNDQSRKRVASASAMMAANGGQISSGSPLDVLADMAAQGKMEEETARWTASRQAAGYAQQAKLDQYQARGAATGGYLQGGATLLSTGAKIASPSRYGAGLT